MKISGFTFVRNAEKLGLPIVESITSILPLVDEFVVNVGNSSDNTLKLIKSIKSKKTRIVFHDWDDRYTEKMRIYAVQTNLAMYECKGDWLFYIQADEVVHENDLKKIKHTILENDKDRSVQGLLFHWHHFWGSYNYKLDSYLHYRREIRVIRNFLGTSSWKDAQGFRLDGKKLKVKDSEAHIYHYGWVLPHDQGVEKTLNHSHFYRGKEATKSMMSPDKNNFFYDVDPYILRPFKGTHPSVMKKRITSFPETFDITKCHKSLKGKHLKRRILTFLERTFKLRLGEYKNFILLK